MSDNEEGAVAPEAPEEGDMAVLERHLFDVKAPGDFATGGPWHEAPSYPGLEVGVG